MASGMRSLPSGKLVTPVPLPPTMVKRAPRDKALRCRKMHTRPTITSSRDCAAARPGCAGKELEFCQIRLESR